MSELVFYGWCWSDSRWAYRLLRWTVLRWSRRWGKWKMRNHILFYDCREVGEVRRFKMGCFVWIQLIGIQSYKLVNGQRFVNEVELSWDREDSVFRIEHVRFHGIMRCWSKRISHFCVLVLCREVFLKPDDLQKTMTGNSVIKQKKKRSIHPKRIRFHKFLQLFRGKDSQKTSRNNRLKLPTWNNRLELATLCKALEVKTRNIRLI